MDQVIKHNLPLIEHTVSFYSYISYMYVNGSAKKDPEALLRNLMFPIKRYVNTSQICDQFGGIKCSRNNV